jgi:hypothetical protein
MIPYWPSNALPYPSPDQSFTFTDTLNSARADDSSLLKTRTVSVAQQRAQFTLDMSIPQFKLFRSWVVDKLNNGQNWFRMDIAITSAFNRSAYCRIVGGAFKVSFKDSTRVTASFELEVDLLDFLTNFSSTILTFDSESLTFDSFE